MGLREELGAKSEQLDVAAGLLVGLVRSLTLGVSLFALASIVFTGELAAYVLQGAAMFFVGTAILSLFLAVFGKFPAPVATTPIPVALVMILAGESIPLEGHALYLTYVLVIIGCAMVTGMLFYAIGQFRLANFFRFVPFNVAAGALAGSGVLILLMALRLAGLSFDPASWPALLEPVTFWKWASSLGFGLSLVLITRIWRKFWVLPLAFAVFCVLFHMVLQYLGVSMDAAIAAGLFMDVDSQASLWPAVSLSELQSAHWRLVVSQGLNAIVLFLVLLVLTVVSFSQLELGASMDFDWNREFKRHGIANLLSGFGGGVPGATVASATLPNIALQANTPVTSVVIAVCLLLFVFFGEGVLRLVPLPATSGFLMSVAVPLISDWLLKSRKRLDTPEYLMLVGICITIVLVGFLEAIALGILLSLVFFAVRMSQVRVIESEYSIQDRRSRRSRSIPDQVVLKTLGHRARVYRLRGYLFFGSAFTLAGQLKQALREGERSLVSIIDLKAVTGFDISALDSLKSYVQRAKETGTKIVFSSASNRFVQEVKRDFNPGVLSALEWADDEEEALTKAEGILIAHHRNEKASAPRAQDELQRDATSALLEHLDRLVAFEELAADLHNLLTSLEYEDQQPIALAGEQQSGAQLLIRGRASVQNTNKRRLYECEAGAVIETPSAIQPQEAHASHIAEGPCETLLVTPKELERLESENNHLALKLYKYLLASKTDVRTS